MIRGSIIPALENIPSHPLLVHLPIVLVPLSFIANILMVVIPTLRRRYGSLAIVILAMGFAGTILAARSGRTLERSYRDSGRSIPELLRNHIEMGERLQYMVGIYLVLMTAWIWRARRHDMNPSGDDGVLSQTRLVSAAVIVLVLTAGSFSAISTLRTGHSGAQSVWETVMPN